MELGQELEAKLVFGVAARVEHVPAAGDAGDEADHRQNQHGRRGLPSLRGHRPEQRVNRGLRLEIDAVHRKLKHAERQRAGQELAGMAPKLSAECCGIPR